MYRIWVTTVLGDYILKKKFNSREEAEELERQVLNEFKPVSDWKIMEANDDKK